MDDKFVNNKDGYFWDKLEGLEPCAVENYIKCSNCDYACGTYHQLPKLLQFANIPKKYQGKLDLVAETGNEKSVFVRLQNYNNNIVDHVQKGQGLFLYSDTKGNGKTSWAIKIMRNYLEQIAPAADIHKEKCRAVYINVPSYMFKKKANISDYDEDLHYLEQRILKADLVVWDDIGRENASGYSRETLYSFINHLYEQERAQIFTSNFSREQLTEDDMLGEQVTDRIKEMCMPLRFTGIGRRDESAWYHTK